ncbi:MAG: hypothetical protein ACYS18_13010 [Planctomycetota bacterium]|jgi:hypothetical protein
MKKILDEAEPDVNSRNNAFKIGMLLGLCVILTVILLLQFKANSRANLHQIASPELKIDTPASDRNEITPAVATDTPRFIINKSQSEDGTSIDLFFFMGCTHRPRIKQTPTFNANDSARKNIL